LSEPTIVVSSLIRCAANMGDPFCKDSASQDT
jgi:hypothetical protein